MLRRPGLVAVALLLVAPVALPVQAGAASGGTRLRGWSMDLDSRAAEPGGQRVHTRRVFETVGVTWASTARPEVEVRTMRDGAWTVWRELHPLGGAKSTEPSWVGPSHDVQVRVDQWRRGLQVVLVDPGYQPDDATAGETSALETDEGTTSARASSTKEARLHHAPMPRILTRADWSARERWRGTAPVYLNRIKQAHVHHTASSTDYRRSDVPGIIRSMYWYHTQQLGWSDLGYNFLVDRFGRVWEGRYGGIRRSVRGAHTLGFNHVSFGVAAIGNFEKSKPTRRTRGSLVKLLAWKLDVNGRNPAGRTRVWSSGSDRYPDGTRVRLPVVDGHRDTNQTACPGIRLYNTLPGLRVRAAERADQWNWS